MKFFNDHKLIITTNTNAEVINFLDVTLDRCKGLSKLDTKKLHNHNYIDRRSNHHNRLLDNLHKTVQYMLPTKSSNKEIFDDIKARYNKGLEHSNQNVKLEYIVQNNNKDKKISKKLRKRNIM